MRAKRQKTAKIDLPEALRQINTKLDSVTANLKHSLPGSVDYGTTLRTEIYTSGGEVDSPGHPPLPLVTPPVKAAAKAQPSAAAAYNRMVSPSAAKILVYP